jgi:hypothetical protein
LTEDVFRTFMATHDVRELHLRGLDPFGASPLKLIFHQRLVDSARGSVLFLALMVGSVPVAFSFNLLDRSRVIFCLDAFDPRWSASSPGKLINNLAADALAKRGIEAIDLTPGGDAYKEEVANSTETIESVVLFPGLAAAYFHDLKGLAKRTAKSVSPAMGLSRDRAERIVRLVRRFATGGPMRDGLAALWRWAASQQEVAQYQLDRVDDAFPLWNGHPRVRVDAIDDFLLYSGAGPAGSRQDLMREALSRLKRGQRCCTVVEHGRLVHAGWVEGDAKSVSVDVEGFEWPLPPKTARLHVLDTEADRATCQGLVRRLADEAFAGGAERAVVLVETREQSLVEVLDGVGFRLCRRFVSERRLGRIRRFEQSGGAA